jgi:hypothetical protein
MDSKPLLVTDLKNRENRLLSAGDKSAEAVLSVQLQLS